MSPEELGAVETRWPPRTDSPHRGPEAPRLVGHADLTRSDNYRDEEAAAALLVPDVEPRLAWVRIAAARCCCESLELKDSSCERIGTHGRPERKPPRAQLRLSNPPQPPRLP